MIEFGRIEFVDRHGVVRSIAGCSAAGIFEFEQRRQQVRAFLEKQPESVAVDSLYRASAEFKYYADRMLELNGIDPDWVTVTMLCELLFGRVNKAGEAVEGFLVTLNRPTQSHQSPKDPKIKIDSKAAAIALIATHCGSISEAYEIANIVPCNELWEILRLYGRYLKSPEDRAKEDYEVEFNDWAKSRRAERMNER